MELLGEGGFGVVYRAISHRTKDVYALKTIRDELTRDEAVRTLFRKEAQIWIDLERHPHLVQLHFVDEVSQRLFLAMEFIPLDGDGTNSLDGHFRRRRPDLARSLRWAIEFCHGMEYAYSRGVRCHRDIKPANVLIDPSGRVKISDFGIAGLALAPGDAAGAGLPAGPTTSEALDGDALAHTMAGSSFGTPTHMPPEQFADAASCDQRSDIYAFGVVLFQLATGGTLPFLPPPLPRTPDIGTQLWRAFRRLHEQADVPRLDSPLDPIVARCLRKKPQDRYPGFRDLRSEIESLLRSTSGEVVAAPDRTQLAAWELSNKGTSFASLGRWDEALACYDRALELGDPRPAVIHNNRGNALRHLGRLPEAEKALQQAIVLDPAFAEPWVNQGLLLVDLNRLDEAAASFRRALAIDPVHVDGWISLGAVLGRQGHPEEELACCNKAIEYNPRAADALFNRGNVLHHLGRLGEAIASLDRCLESAPRYAKAWVTKGIILSESGRAAEGLATFEQALALDANDAQTWYNKGNAHAQLADFTSAHACFAKAVTLAPDFPLGWNNKGLCELRLGRMAEGAASLKQFLARGGWQNPAEDAKVAGLIAQIEAGAGVHPGPPAAPAVFRPPPGSTPGAEASPLASPQSVAAIPDAATVAGIAAAEPRSRRPLPRAPRLDVKEWNDRGHRHFGAKQFAEALACFEKALAIAPGNVTGLNNKANALFSLDRRAEALAIHERILEIDPLFAGSWVNKGAMEKILGRESDALRTLSDFLEIAGRDDAWAVRNAESEAAPLRKKGVRPAPRGLLGWLGLGCATAVKREMETALTHFDAAIRAASHRGLGHFFKGQVLSEIGQLNDALPCYDAAIAREPHDPRPWHSKGLALAKLRRFEEAVACYDRADEIDPRDVASWSDRGKALGGLKRYDQSIASLAKACALDPEAPAPWLNRALAEDESGREADALDSYEAFLETAAGQTARDLTPQANQARRRVAALRSKLAGQAGAEERSFPPPVPTASNAPQPPRPSVAPADAVKRGQICLNQHRHAPALEWFEQALAAESSNAAAWIGKGESLCGLKRLAEAADALARALEIDPRDAAVWMKQAAILESLGRLDQAVNAAERALSIDPRNLSALTVRGTALLRAGRVEQALAVFDSALAIDARHPAARFYKACVEDQLGHRPEALRSYQQFLSVAPPHLTAQIEHARARLVALRSP